MIIFVAKAYYYVFVMNILLNQCRELFLFTVFDSVVYGSIEVSYDHSPSFVSGPAFFARVLSAAAKGPPLFGGISARFGILLALTPGDK